MSQRQFIFLLVSCILASILINCVYAEPEPEPKPRPVPEPVKGGRRSSYFNQPANAKFRSAIAEDDLPQYRQADVAVVENLGADDDDDDDDDLNGGADVQVGGQVGQTGGKGEPSSGRLFLKKFLLFRNMFGNTNAQQPVILLTGNTGATSPTTITSTGTIPTATGTITTSPATRSMREDEDQEEAAVNKDGSDAAIDPQALQAALAAGAQEYVVTDAEIKGTSDSKATKEPNRIRLRRNGSKKGQVISVRIPPRYRRYFKNGQKVMLNTQNNRRQPGKKRVVRRRVNKVRRRNNINNTNNNGNKQNNQIRRRVQAAI